jgi:hypothetical protein
LVLDTTGFLPEIPLRRLETQPGLWHDDGGSGAMNVINPPRHIVWSTDQVDLDDPFQRKWYIRQVIEHGRAGDIATLDLDEVARVLDELNLPPHLYRLWARFLRSRDAKR